ncbi:hypothetical protein MFIFM68171_06621 [Madurella fahalii]|uniref:C2H2-type domain-containing protein n=1 Tax=Madurella fahalii TaxID=1157608 RepID=A0ABQ0GF63_9PEZI
MLPAGEETGDSLLSQTPRSDDSSVLTETFLDERKARMIDRIVLEVTKRIKAIFFQVRGGIHPTATCPGQNGASALSEGSKMTTLGVSNDRKRNRDDRDAGDSNDDEEETGNPKSKDPVNSKEENAGYACPYFKYNPAMYKRARNCPGPGWPSVRRVKEHLYRRHRQPRYRCGRCWQPFKDEVGYLDHQRLPEPCSLRDMEHVEGFDAAQERSLRSRKRTKGQTELSETEKWREMYKILFPHVDYDDIPSPFYEYGELMSSMKANGPQSNSGDRLRECEEFLLREVPLRLRQALCLEAERNFSIVEETLRREASSCVSTLISQVFQEFRSQSSTAAQPRQATAVEPGVQTNSATGEEDALGELDFGLFNMDPFALIGNEEYRYDGDALLENLMQPTDETESGKKLSDSGYESGTPEVQRQGLL